MELTEDQVKRAFRDFCEQIPYDRASEAVPPVADVIAITDVNPRRIWREFSNEDPPRSHHRLRHPSCSIPARRRAWRTLQAGYSRLDEISGDRWDALSQKRIFFGHKSVGVNIIEGLEEVMARRPGIKLRYPRDHRPGRFLGPGIRPLSHREEQGPSFEDRGVPGDHGKRRRPERRTSPFSSSVLSTSTMRPISTSLFKSYVELVEDLEKRFPDLKIVTFTVPLLSKPVGIQDPPEEAPGKAALVRGGQRQAEPLQRYVEGPFQGLSLRPGRHRIPHRRHEEGHIQGERKGIRSAQSRLHGRRRPSQLDGTAGRRHRALADAWRISRSRSKP